jgi:hypothetical protein
VGVSGRADLARKNALAALLVVCALGVQVLLTGMALASAVASSGEAAFSQGCASATDSPTTDRDATAPGAHKHGLCCILHSGLAHSIAPTGVSLRLAPPSDTPLPASRENWVSARAPPELEPLVPRGPPASQI